MMLASACGSETRSVGVFGEGTGNSSPTSGPASSAEGTSADSGSLADTQDNPDTSAGDGPKFDTAVDASVGSGDCGCGTDEWSYIWIANAGQGTVSKVNTQTLVEEGRYRTRPDASGNPSRTSVSLGGRAVAVANRHGGVAKVWARTQFCDEAKNGQPGLQTSGGATDVLAWGDDDCVAWYTAFPEYTTQRPVAWAGDVDPISCDDEALWTAGCGGGFTPGFGGSGNVFVHRLDGADGTILDTVEVTGFTCGGFGAYGGAVDTDGNFWIAHNGGGGKLAVIRPDTLDVEVFNFPDNGFAGYGITVDNAGRPWVSSYGGNLGAARFDPETEAWVTVAGFASQGGIQQAADGRIWSTTVAGYSADNDQDGVVWIDDDTAQIGEFVPVPGGTVKGLSLDVDGFLRAVNGSAHKIDPVTLMEVGSYGGLSGPYTYSDMTGWGLQNNVCNPAG